MAHLTKLKFDTLVICGENYLSWFFDVEIHLDTMGLSNTIIKVMKK